MEKALFWTLVHSLWVGLAAAALAGLVILATKRSSSSARYYGLCGILFGFFGIMIFIFCKQWHVNVTPKFIGIVHSIPSIWITNPSTAPSLYCRIVYSLDQTSGWACLLWMLCFSFKTIRLSRELYYIRRLRRERILPIGAEWEVKVWVFRQQLGIQKAVSIFESALVKIPVTLGYLKPVILLPLGLITQLPPEQVDAILWHELAHIRRRDYLVNIFQSAIEALFFFNPAVLWISTLIREERESCCDDIVLGQVYRKRSYLEALLAFQYSGATGLSLGLGDRPHQLIRRLKRMVYQENRVLSGMERFALLAGILVLSAFTMLHPPSKSVLINVAHRDTVPAGRYAMQVDSVPYVPSKMRKEGQPGVILKDTVKVMTKDTLKVMTYNHVDVMSKVDDPFGEKAKGREDMKSADLDRERAKADMAGARLELKSDMDGAHLELKSNRDEVHMDSKSNMDEVHMDSKSNTDEVHMDSKSDVHPEPNPPKLPPLPDNLEHDRQRARLIIVRLIGAKVIPDFKSLVWFGLSTDALIVNGVKQSEELHQQLVNDFNIKEGYGLYYGSVQVTGRGVFLNKEDLEQ